MTDLDEQRRKVEELKRKILEQKRQGIGAPAQPAPAQPAPAQPAPAAERKTETPKPPVQRVQPKPSEEQRKAELEQQQRIEIALRQAEETVRKQQEETPPRVESPKVQQAQHTDGVVSLQAYVQALKQAWTDGAMSTDEQILLATLRKTMGISEEEHASLEQEVQLEIYLQAIVDSWKDGAITPEDLDRLDALRDAPIMRVACPDTPIPFSPQLEQQYMPSAESVVRAVDTVLGR